MMKKAKLSVNVVYESDEVQTNEEMEKEIHRLMSQMVEHAMSIGLFTGETPLEVSSCEYKVDFTQ